MISQAQTHQLKTVFLDNGRELLDNKGRSALLFNLHVLAGDDENEAKNETQKNDNEEVETRKRRMSIGGGQEQLDDDDENNQAEESSSSSSVLLTPSEKRLRKFLNRAQKHIVPDKLQYEIGSSKRNKNLFLDNALRLCVHEGLVPASAVISHNETPVRRRLDSNNNKKNNQSENDYDQNNSINNRSSSVDEIRRRKKLANERIKLLKQKQEQSRRESTASNASSSTSSHPRSPLLSISGEGGDAAAARRKSSSAAASRRKSSNVMGGVANNNTGRKSSSITTSTAITRKQIPLHLMFPSARQQQQLLNYQNKFGRHGTLSSSTRAAFALDAASTAVFGGNNDNKNINNNNVSFTAAASGLHHDGTADGGEQEDTINNTIPLVCPHCSLSDEVPNVTEVRPLDDSIFPHAQYQVSVTALSEDELDERLWTVLTNLSVAPHVSKKEKEDAEKEAALKKKKEDKKKKKKQKKVVLSDDPEDEQQQGEASSSPSSPSPAILESPKEAAVKEAEDNATNSINNNPANSSILDDPDTIAEHFESRVGAPPWHEHWTRLHRFSEDLRERKVANNEAAKVRLASLVHELAVVTAQVRALSQGLLEVDPVHKLRTLESEEKRAEYECNNYNEAIRLIEEQLRYLTELEARSLMHTAVAVEESRRAAATLNDLASYIGRSSINSDLQKNVNLDGLAQLLGDVLATAPICSKDEEHEAEIIGKRKNPLNVMTQRYQCPHCLLLCQFSRYCPATGKRHPEMVIPGKEDEQYDETFSQLNAQALLAEAGLSESMSVGSPIAKMLLMAAKLDQQQQKENELEAMASGTYSGEEGEGEEDQHSPLSQSRRKSSGTGLTKKGSARTLWKKFKKREEGEEGEDNNEEQHQQQVTNNNNSSDDEHDKTESAEKKKQRLLQKKIDEEEINEANNYVTHEQSQELGENPRLQRLQSFKKKANHLLQQQQQQGRQVRSGSGSHASPPPLTVDVTRKFSGSTSSMGDSTFSPFTPNSQYDHLNNSGRVGGKGRRNSSKRRNTTNKSRRRRSAGSNGSSTGSFSSSKNKNDDDDDDDDIDHTMSDPAKLNQHLVGHVVKGFYRRYSTERTNDGAEADLSRSASRSQQREDDDDEDDPPPDSRRAELIRQKMRNQQKNVMAGAGELALVVPHVEVGDDVNEEEMLKSPTNTHQQQRKKRKNVQDNGGRDGDSEEDNNVNQNQASPTTTNESSPTLTSTARRRTVHFAASSSTMSRDVGGGEAEGTPSPGKRRGGRARRIRNNNESSPTSPNPTQPNNNAQQSFTQSLALFDAANGTALGASTTNLSLSQSQASPMGMSVSMSPMAESVTAGLGLTHHRGSGGGGMAASGKFAAANSISNIVEDLPDNCIGDDKTAEKIIEEHVSEILQCAVRRDLEGMRWHHRRFSKLLVPEKEGGPNRHIPKSYFEVLLELERMFVEWFAAMVNRQKEDAKIASIGASRIGAASTMSQSMIAGMQGLGGGGSGSPTTTSALKRQMMEDRVRKLQREVRDLKYSIAKRPKGRQAADVDDDDVFEALALRVRNLQRKKGAMRSRLRGANDENRAVETRISMLKGEFLSPSNLLNSTMNNNNTTNNNHLFAAAQSMGTSATDYNGMFSSSAGEVLFSSDNNINDHITQQQYQNGQPQVALQQSTFPVANIMMDPNATRSQTILNLTQGSHHQNHQNQNHQNQQHLNRQTSPLSGTSRTSTFINNSHESNNSNRTTSPPYTPQSRQSQSSIQRANSSFVSFGPSASQIRGTSPSSSQARSLRAGGGFRMMSSTRRV